MGCDEKIIPLLACLVLMASCAGEAPVTDAGGSAVVPSVLETLTATAPQLTTKLTSRDGATLRWEHKDAIALLGQADLQGVPASCIYSTALAAPKASASFKRTPGGQNVPDKTDGLYLAVYPASPAYLEWGADGYVVLAPSSEQTVRNRCMDKSSALMIAASEGSEFTFRHLVSYIKLTVTPASAPFTRVVVRSVDGSRNMVSRIRAGFDGAFSYSLLPGNAADSVALVSADGSCFPEGAYLIAINPDTYAKGFSLSFRDSGGSIASRDYPGPFSAVPGEVIDLGEVEDPDVSIPDAQITYPRTEAGKLLKGPLASKIVDILWDTTYTVTGGLDYYRMKVKTDDPDDNTMDAYLLRADLSMGLDIKVAISDKTTPSYLEKMVLTEMAALMDTPSKPVYAMVNGDFCDNKTGRPRGPLHASGIVYWPTYSLDSAFPQQGLTYIGMTNDGRMTIGLRDDYASVKLSLRECTGAGRLLVNNSEICAGGNSRDPRTAIGYTPGGIVWMLTVDGRHKGTEGMTYGEMASIFFALGCEKAVNMDGGGSAEMIARNPATGRIELCNWPSDPTDGDGGIERARPNAWAIVKK